MVAAAKWYDQQSTGLGERFLSAVEATERLIQEQPNLGTRCGHEVRKWMVKRFPYLIINQELPDQIRIYAIAHTARRPGYWRDRLV